MIDFYRFNLVKGTSGRWFRAPRASWPWLSNDAVTKFVEEFCRRRHFFYAKLFIKVESHTLEEE